MLAVSIVPFMLAGTASPASAPVSVFPIAGSRLATRQTQISFRGIAPSAIGSVSVTGSISGPHYGRVVADSDGRGASFYPRRPFTAGEVVTVRTGLNIVRGTGGTFRFTIERSWGAIPPPIQRAVAPRQRGDTQSFHSRPDLTPVSIDVDHRYSGAGDVFLTPMHGPTQWGPMIIGPRGSLIWFDPMPGPYTVASNLRLQRYLGQPVLTFWEGYVNVDSGQGVDVILNRHYQQIATVRAGNGLMADLHEFTITAQNTALITAYSLVHWDGTGVGRGKDMDVVDCTVQEIDIPTGNVLFQWDSLDHIGLRDSYLVPATNPGVPYDYFHVNSIQQDSRRQPDHLGPRYLDRVQDQRQHRVGDVDVGRQALELQDGTGHPDRLPARRDPARRERHVDLRRRGRPAGAPAVPRGIRASQHAHDDRDAPAGG